MLRINRENLRNSHETPWLILDLVMLGILFVNLTWLIFDALINFRACKYPKCHYKKYK